MDVDPSHGVLYAPLQEDRSGDTRTRLALTTTSQNRPDTCLPRIEAS